MIGRTLSHYEITGRLGAGGMGEVYLARDLNLGRKVALKVLPTEVAEDPSRLRRLQREAKALATLDHPNIVTVYSVEEDEGTHFLTMAYVEGRTLAEMIPDEGMPIEQLVDLSISMADALRAAHERGIIHRDLKPANIMVDHEGRLRVLDFGLARVETTVPPAEDEPTQKMDQPITRQGIVMGTVPYMSPEQAEGMLLDARTDIFSLGVILYEMATGSRPFKGLTPASLISSILRDDPPSMVVARPELPAGLNKVVVRCLAKSRDERMPSAQMLRDELEGLRRELISASLSGTGSQAVTASPGWKKLGPLLIVAVMSAAGVFFWQRGIERGPAQSPAEVTAPPAPEIRSLAVLPLRNLSGDPDQEYFSDGVTEAIITSLSRIGALRVTARSSSMRFKGTNTPPKEVGASLGVGLIIEGSIMREEGRVRISAQLIDAEKEQVVWSEQYDRAIASILELQSEVAESIARQVSVALTPEESARLASAPDYDPAAYDAYLKGIFHLNRFSATDFNTAMSYFERSLEIDPEFSLGHVGVGLVWAYRQQIGLSPPAEAGPKMRFAVERALELQGDLAEAHAAMAAYWCWSQWDWERAEASFERALALNPNLADTRAFYSLYLSFMQRHAEAAEQIDRAISLDPLNALFQVFRGNVLIWAKRYDDAVESYERSFQIAPNHRMAVLNLAHAHFLRGDLENCYRNQLSYFELIGFTEGVQALTEGYEAGGFVTAMQRASVAARKSPKVKGLAVSLYAGDKNAALDILEQLYEERSPNMPSVNSPREEKVLGAEPRYKALLEKMKLPRSE